jgi:hypothetical protein
LATTSGASRHCAVILVGIAYYPAKSASDKTFMRDVAHAAREEHGLDVRVVSIAETRNWVATPPQRSDSTLEPTYAPRPFHRVTAVTQGSLAHRRHGAVRDYAEKTSTVLSLGPVLARLRDSSGARYVHFFDNLGPTTGLVARSLGLRAGVTLLSSHGNSRSIARRAYWRASFLGVHDIVAGSDELARDLRRSGVRVRAVIPWAASVEPAAAFTPFSARRKVVWAGPLQCSAADELGLTAAAMATLPRALPDAEPEVWPKPEFVSAYSKIAQAFALPVHVANSGFLDDLSRVKVLVSPVPSSDYIVAPPLTWLEAVESGCVVVTTPCRGLPTQLVESGGIVVARNCSVPALNEAIAKAWHSAGPAVKRMPTARAAAARYAELWRMHDRL